MGREKILLHLQKIKREIYLHPKNIITATLIPRTIGITSNLIENRVMKTL